MTTTGCIGNIQGGLFIFLNPHTYFLIQQHTNKKIICMFDIRHVDYEAFNQRTTKPANKNKR